MNKFKAALAGLIFFLTGCSGVDTSIYKNETPKFDLRQYLNGDIEAWGIFQDYSGKVASRFYVRMNASWQGDTGTLKENFKFSDGTEQKRTWVIKITDEHHFIANA